MKPPIIEALFNDPSRWENGKIVRTIVTLSEVSIAIQIFNQNNPTAKKKLSSMQPANFIKDFFRKIKSAEKNWPPSILSAGYTAVQLTGGGNCFEFIALPAGQTSAFAVETLTYPRIPVATKLAVVQTLSLDLMNKALSRRDENWLQSLAVSLHILQLHLALHPHDHLPFRQIGHMQSNLKLRKTEVDGLYYGYLDDGKLALITMEVKGSSDDIIESQLINQLDAVQNLPKVKTLLKSMKSSPEEAVVIPMAMKLVDRQNATNVPGIEGFGLAGKKMIYIVDYGPIAFSGASPSTLTVRAETLFDLRPPIDGLNA